MWFQPIPFSTFPCFDGRQALAWRISATISLMLAAVTVGLVPQHSIFLMGMAIAAGVISILVEVRTNLGSERIRVPEGTLALWWFVMVTVSLHASFPGIAWRIPGLGFDLAQDQLWQVLSIACLAFSFGFNGSRLLMILLAALFFVAGIWSFLGVDRTELFKPSSLLLIFSYSVATVVLMARHARANASLMNHRLLQLSEKANQARARLALQTDELASAREGMLGRSDSQGEHAGSSARDWLAQSGKNFQGELGSTLPSLGFEELVGDLRSAFQNFQIMGRERGEIRGAVRFVFFPPASGYDAQALVSLDREQFISGVEACLRLAYESLPEVAGRRREGVVRLAVRRGLRAVEVVIEDNGRGLGNQNLEIDSKLKKLRDSVEAGGGRLDRLTRLGVGGRTSIELKILREVPLSAKYRPTVLHNRTVAEFN